MTTTTKAPDRSGAFCLVTRRPNLHRFRPSLNPAKQNSCGVRRASRFYLERSHRRRIDDTIFQMEVVMRKVILATVCAGVLGLAGAASAQTGPAAQDSTRMNSPMNAQAKMMHHRMSKHHMRKHHMTKHRMMKHGM